MRTRLAAALKDGNLPHIKGDVDVMHKANAGEPFQLPAALGDDILRTVGKPRPPATTFVPAAVLIPLVEHRGGRTVLLTQRTATLSQHGGQVAFAGGRQDPQDLDADACALREAWEEIGLDRTRVEILGRLPLWTTGTGFRITPVVAAVTPPLTLKPDPREVDAVFEVPLSFVFDPVNHRRVSRDFFGINRVFYEMPYQDRYIWGATAGMLVNLYHALMPAH